MTQPPQRHRTHKPGVADSSPARDTILDTKLIYTYDHVVNIHYPFATSEDEVRFAKELAEEAKSLVPGKDLKFVMVEDTGKLLTAIFDRKAEEHYRIADRLLTRRDLTDEDFKGAGFIGPDGPYYDSSSCKAQLLRDKPKDADEAQRLLQELRAKLIEIGVLESHD